MEVEGRKDFSMYTCNVYVCVYIYVKSFTSYQINVGERDFDEGGRESTHWTINTRQGIDERMYCNFMTILLGYSLLLLRQRREKKLRLER